MSEAKKEAPAAREKNPEPFVRAKIKSYKVHTSQGRGIAGQTLELPKTEADKLVAAGDAVLIGDL